MSGARSAIVMGGGVAGIAAAVRLADAGLAVTLVETRKRLGGRATSHIDQATGELIDNCQHVLLGCCTSLIDLYERLGVADQIAWHEQLHFFDKQGHHDVLAPADLPAPLHLSPAMLGFDTLTLGDKLAIGRAMVAMLRMGLRGRCGLADLSFAGWLARQRQPRSAVERFWAVIVISACNQAPARLSAEYAVQVFQEGFLAHRRSYTMGVSTVPLARLYDRAEAAITRGGGRLLLGSSVQAIELGADGVVGVRLDDGAVMAADTYISALPHDRLARVVPAEAGQLDARLGGLDCIDVSPIIGIHLWFDRPVCPWPHMIYVDPPLQWVFVRSDAGGPAEAGQHIHGVISAADAWVGRPAEQIEAMTLREMGRYLPDLDATHLIRSRVIKEKRATFSASPGVNAYRPSTTGAIANLLLAGDWTATGWPATMEGAARSGYAAASAATGRPMGVEDLPISEVAQLLGLR